MKYMCSLTAIVLALVAAPLFAGVKPVVGIPDYNGTYGGTPNTGSVYDVTKGSSVNYTTLYRDNYRLGKVPTLCAGERCGSHAGVDIAVPSGTPVVASLSGKVVVSKCDSDTDIGYGGLVIIKSPNPYVAGTYVYLVYAHLDDWNDYAVDKSVTQGAVIGKSGGDPNGACPGASTAKHLHFQVDKNPPNATTGRPWGPKQLFTEGAEHPDTNFDVTDYTHNPIPFVTGWAYNFTFAKDGNTELWGCRNVFCGTALSQLWMDGSSVYPYAGRSSWIPETSCTGSDGWPCSREITLDANIFKKAKITLSYACHTNFGYILYRNEYSDNWYSVKYSTQLGVATYTFDLSGISEWRGIITDFMIQPGVGCTYYASPYREYFVNQVYFLP